MNKILLCLIYFFLSGISLQATQLCIAARYGCYKSVKTLLEQGVAADDADDSGNTPLRAAIRAWCRFDQSFFREYQKLVEIAQILAKYDHNGSDKECITYYFDNHVDQSVSEFLFWYQKEHSEDKTLKLIFDRSALGDRVNYCSKTLFRQTFFKCYQKTIKLLLDHGADINIVSDFGGCLLHDAIRIGNPEVIKFLLDHGANVDKANWCGGTPLHLAAQEGHQEIIRVLLDHGANINTVNHQGESPLHDAAIYGHQEAAIVLLAYGANEHAVDIDGKTAFNRAKEDTVVKILRLLPEFMSGLRASKCAFLTAQHQRCGKGSRANVISQESLKQVCSYLNRRTCMDNYELFLRYVCINHCVKKNLEKNQ